MGLLAVIGCGPARPAQFRNGAKLYDRQSHQYFGKVVGYERTHDFHNGTPAQSAILIEPPNGGEEGRVWGACGTCTATFEVKP